MMPMPSMPNASMFNALLPLATSPGQAPMMPMPMSTGTSTLGVPSAAIEMPSADISGFGSEDQLFADINFDPNATLDSGLFNLSGVSPSHPSDPPQDPAASTTQTGYGGPGPASYDPQYDPQTGNTWPEGF